jgi:hypothetical protein
MEKDGNSQLKYLTTKIEPKKTREIHRWKMGIELTKDSFGGVCGGKKMNV